MADQNTPAITTDDIKKTKEYTDALDKLNDSLTGVNSALPKFADGIDAGLKAIAEKLPEVISSMTKLNAQNKELAANGQKPANILSQLASSMFSWNSIISVGITLLTTYGSTFVNWLIGLAKGETQLTSLAKAMKDNAIIAKSLTETKLNGDKAAQTELASLKALYNASQQKAKDDKLQLEAAKALKEQWSTAFQSFTEHDIVVNKAAKAYENLKDQIIATNRAEAAKKSTAANEGRIAENKQKLDAEKKNKTEIEKALKEAEDKLNEKEPFDATDFVVKLFFDPDKMAKTDAVNEQLNLLAASKKIIADLNEDTELLTQQNKGNSDDIQKYIDQFGVNVLVGNKNTSVRTQKNEVASMPNDDAEFQEQMQWQARSAALLLESYARQIDETNSHFDKLKSLNKKGNAGVNEIEKQRVAALTDITDKFQKEGLEKLNAYQTELTTIAERAGKKAEDLAIEDLKTQEKAKLDVITKAGEDSVKRQADIQTQINKFKDTEDKERLEQLTKNLNEEIRIQAEAGYLKIQIEANTLKDIEKINAEVADKKAAEAEAQQEKNQENNIRQLQSGGHDIKALNQQKILLDMQFNAATNAAKKTGKATADIEADFAAKKKAVEEQLVNAKIHAGDKYINAALKNANKDSAIYKAAFVAKKATAIADVIISTKKSLIASFEGYASLPFIGQALAIAQGAFIAGEAAASIAQITKQKPGFAQGGQFRSDGRGALLSGYSRTDDTNAYLRSGEAVVVSEAMRNPWARNLVSAINVAHGGRDFSVGNPGRGYAVGGIFTDGGNANRYYSQPANDVKDLANTLAYQMINNFPPIYVDVKDVNNQQNILAQTVNRVNL